MKLKSYILVGYIISTLLTIIVVFWAIQRMLIEEREIYFLVGMTLMASFVGAGISLFLLSPVFTSLAKLKEHAKLSMKCLMICRRPLIPWKKANEKRA